MGDRAHCLVCNSYLTSILSAWRDGEPCPQCGASEEDSATLGRVKTIQDGLKSQKIEKATVDRNRELETENAKLKIEINLLEKDLWNFGNAIDDLQSNFKNYQDRILAVKKHMERK